LALGVWAKKGSNEAFSLCGKRFAVKIIVCFDYVTNFAKNEKKSA